MRSEVGFIYTPFKGGGEVAGQESGLLGETCSRLSVICCVPIHDVHWTFLSIAYSSIVCLCFPSPFYMSLSGDLRLLVSFVCPVNPPLHARESPLNLLVPEAVAVKPVHVSALESKRRYEGLPLCTSHSDLVDRSSNMKSEAGPSRWRIEEERSYYDIFEARARSPLRQELGGSAGPLHGGIHEVGTWPSQHRSTDGGLSSWPAG